MLLDVEVHCRSYSRSASQAPSHIASVPLESCMRKGARGLMERVVDVDVLRMGVEVLEYLPRVQLRTDWRTALVYISIVLQLPQCPMKGVKGASASPH